MRLLSVFVFGGLTVLLGAQVYSSLVRQGAVNREFQELNQKLQKAQMEHDELRADFDYYSNPENLEKEIRARFNYKKPGEKTLIIVPQQPSSTRGASE